MKKYVILQIMFTILVAACSNYVYDLRGKFDESVTKYNSLYRWNELDKAGLFVADPIRDAFMARTKESKNVKIVEYRILSIQYDGEMRKATVETEIDYYLASTSRMKTLRDTQEWAYIEQRGIKGWRLLSLVPEFK
ncbi:MAG TPA: hypothetical protein VLX29_01490 [Nitrospirota bacterium]|nr:hypothetical protein [Nitrospirota bacterium]